MERETFKSRLGFILISAGCAIGLGNVWRFPYITGQYGGAAFILLFLFFLIMFGLPIMIIEFSVGRASHMGIAQAFNKLEPAGTKWHIAKWVGLAGLYLLMMFYTTVAGWVVAYIPKMATAPFGTGTFNAPDMFSSMLASPFEMVGWMIVTCLGSLFICSLGLQNGIERITKVMMVALLALIGVLAVRACTLPGAVDGIAFYLLPNFDHLLSSPKQFSDALFAAMGQAFFTLSIGIGSMEIFGSYINKKYTLGGEAVRIAALDTFVAVATGLIIFPACFAFSVSPDSGPGLVFITLPAVFEQMWLGNVWAALFFVFMAFAGISTVIAVFEGILAFWMDQWGFSRKRAVAINCVLIPLLSVPCALGFNVWSGVELPGVGNIQAIEDFLVSNNLLVLGSLVFVLFCTTKRGWGWKNFLAEANSGEGMKVPQWMYFWVRFCVPVLIVIVLLMGWVPLLQTWLT